MRLRLLVGAACAAVVLGTFSCRNSTIANPPKGTVGGWYGYGYYYGISGVMIGIFPDTLAFNVALDGTVQVWENGRPTVGRLTELTDSCITFHYPLGAMHGSLSGDSLDVRRYTIGVIGQPAPANGWWRMGRQHSALSTSPAVSARIASPLR